MTSVDGTIGAEDATAGSDRNGDDQGEGFPLAERGDAGWGIRLSGDWESCKGNWAGGERHGNLRVGRVASGFMCSSAGQVSGGNERRYWANLHTDGKEVRSSRPGKVSQTEPCRR